MSENRVQNKMVQAPMFFLLVVAEVDEILDVIMRSDVLYILGKRQRKDVSNQVPVCMLGSTAMRDSPLSGAGE